jgi:hypothetical protein
MSGRRWPGLRGQGGFTIIEVMVASLVLLVGLVGTVTLINAANATTVSTQAREQAVSLERELLEATHSVPYQQLSPTSVVSQVQAAPGLRNAGVGPGWTIQRRGFTYTVAVGVCSVDDPSNGYGTENPDTFCATTASPNPSCNTLLGTSGNIAGVASAVTSANATLTGQQAIGSCGLDPDLDGRVDNLTQTDVPKCTGGACTPAPTGDSNPDNYKRILVLVTWTVNQVGHYALQSSTIPNPGPAGGPTISSLATTATLPITNTYSATTVPFAVTTSNDATAVSWSVNGTPMGNASGASGSWNFSWNIGTAGSGTEVMDGSYVITVTAYNQNSVYGPNQSLTATLNRRQPYAPTGFVGGLNPSVVELEWIANKESDISGYRVYRVGTPNTKVCDVPVTRLSCQDAAPPSTYPIKYYIVAVDHDNASPPQLREGDPSAQITVTNSNQAPNPPTGLAASPSNGNTVLAWTAPATSDPDGDPIAFYRIYRDGSAYVNRYDRTLGAQTTYTDTATGGVAHTYYITAVDPQLMESPIVGPVTR